MMAGASQIQLLFTLIVSCVAGHFVEALSENQIPAIFNDGLLLAPPTDGFKDFQNLGRVLKLSSIFQPKLVATKFSIFTRRAQVKDIAFNPNHYCYPDTCHGPFQYNLEAMLESGFDPSKRTIIMTPGFLTSDEPEFILRAKDLWLQLEDVNFIMVTWSDGNRYIYNAAVANTPIVARQISIFLYYLAELHGASINDQNFLNRIQLVGHSLGAHISGFVGKEFDGRLGRITGLDPAGPAFKDFDRTRRLDKSDALLVTVIHSNRGDMDYMKAAAGGLKDVKVKLLGKLHNNEVTEKMDGNTVQDVIEDDVVEYSNPWFGIDQQVGDLDYYANDGAEQPGCKDFLHICDHGRSTNLYVDLLSYELTKRTLSSSKEWLKRNRVLAFNSDSYDNFLIGDNFNLKCPVVLDKKEALSTKLEETFDSCAVPLDVVSPVEEVIAELHNKHHIDLNKDHYNPHSKFWFKTQENAPYFGDHYLLKVEVDRDSAWDETCGLKSEITMADDSRVKTDPIKGVQLVSNENFHGLAIPFINPIGFDATSARNNILAKTKVARKEEFPNISQSLVKVVPLEVRLSITTTDIKNVIATKSVGRNCDLNIKSIEVQPVVGTKRNLAAIYSDPRAKKSLTPRGGWFGHEQKKDLNRKIECDGCDPNVLSVSGNPTVTKKFSKLVIRHA